MQQKSPLSANTPRNLTDSSGGFPGVRMRRNRQANWSRRLNAETELTPSDLIWPLFVTDGAGRREAVPSMPGVDRVSVDLIGGVAEEAMELGIPAVALFPFYQSDQANRGRRRSLQSG